VTDLRELADVRFLPPRPGPIVHATDLGNVVTLKHGNVYLLTDQFGDIHPDSRGLGLYHQDTRILSCSSLRVNGVRPALLHASAGGNYRGAVQLTNPDYMRNPGPDVEPVVALVRRSIGIQRDRVLGAGALLEQLRLVNYTSHDESVAIEIGLACDHADIFEVRGYPRATRGELLPIALTDQRVTFRYLGTDGCQRLTYVTFSEPGIAGPALPESAAAVELRWNWTIAAGETRDLEWRVWSGEAVVEPSAGRRRTAAAVSRGELFPEPPRVSADQGATAYRAWTSSTTSVDTDNELFDLAIHRSLADLRLLLNDGPGPGERYMSAGVPWFATLFGRDAIITALQLLAFRPQLAVETLGVLANRQATTLDDWHDAEPGKILHELRNSEMVRAGELPFSPYYGTIDATPLWLVLFGATFDWTGDRALLDRHWPNALAALEWIDRWGDSDGDGFVEYGRRSSGGLYNQGWKDSGDAVRDRHGIEAQPPIALAEVQGYVYDAKVRMAALATARGEAELATRLGREAAELRDRFEAAFWVSDQAFYAMALDGSKRPADAIGSNPGHCLWSGIVRPDRARAVAERLLAPSMFSGWGIRTYASEQPGFNPIGYHTGSVWPHDTSIVAAGLKRYGLHEEANRLVGAIFEAGQHFPDNRLPELFCGFDRDATGAPVPYPVACSPQAWAAGSAFQSLQTMLGLDAHAERRELELVRPQLPTWLSRVTLTNVRVGDAAVDLLFHRWRGTTSAEVLRKVGDVAVTIRL
jgi:glycogen debranching enzyme